MGRAYTRFCFIVTFFVSAVGVGAQEAIVDTTLLKYDAVIMELKYYRVNYTYESVDPGGNPVTLTAAMVFPTKVFERKEPITIDGKDYDASGLLLSNHFTITRASEAPTRTKKMDIEGPMAALGPQFITISPDGYGFGATVDKPQAYLMADLTARNCVDAVRAARRLLSQMGYTYGDLFSQIGYSQGGHSAMAVQRYVDTYGADKAAIPQIDYTCCGGGPYDISAMLDTLLLPNARYMYPCALPLIVHGQISGAGLGISYSDCFRSPLDTKTIEWLDSKRYSTGAINDSIFKVVGGNDKTGVLVDDILCTENFNREDSKTRQFLNALKENSLVADWTPNELTHFYLYHSTDDEIVPYYNFEHMVDYLSSCGISDDRLQTYTATGSHEGTAILFVLNALDILLNLESSYVKGTYTPVSIANLMADHLNRTTPLSGWYNMQGQRLPAKPHHPGLYIHDGKKVVVGE